MCESPLLVPALSKPRSATLNITYTFAEAGPAKRKRNQCSEIPLFQKLLPRSPEQLTSSSACQPTQATFKLKKKTKDLWRIRNEEFLNSKQLDRIFKSEMKKWYI